MSSWLILNLTMVKIFNPSVIILSHLFTFGYSPLFFVDFRVTQPLQVTRVRSVLWIPVLSNGCRWKIPCDVMAIRRLDFVHCSS